MVPVSLVRFGLISLSVACAFVTQSQSASAQGIQSARLEAQLNQPFNNPTLNSMMLGQLAQAPTIIPTDIVPLPGPHEGASFGQAFQLRALQRLPSKLFFTGINETSFRLETNPFQDPSRSTLQKNITQGIPIQLFAEQDQVIINNILGQTSQTQQVFRTLPNVTAGWEFTPRTRIYSNYFAIRDSLFHSSILNATTQSVGGGLQHDIPIRQKGNFQINAQFRELFQTGQPDVFDYIPSVTYTYKVRPNAIFYVNGLLQMRGKQPFVAPKREIDPFYTTGILWQKGRWLASASGTFLQNFRQPWGHTALAPINNYSFVCDLELDRQILKKFPGLQAFVRAEPIWNFHSEQAPGFSGFDFRLFYGLRMTVTKTPLTTAMRQIRKDLEEHEVTPPQPTPKFGPVEPSGTPSPLSPLQSSYLAPRSVIR